MENDKKVKMHIVAHTHWDREWYYTFEEYRFRLVRLFDLLLECMEDGRIEYFTMDGQTIAIKDYLQIRPENEKRIRALTESGRLVIGPWYTQPNIFMSCAEAQVRNLLFGRRDMDNWGSGLRKVNYMPDQFGYTSQLPQMMKQFGLETLVGARGLPFGCKTFLRWTGADGTEVDVCALPHSYINACALTDCTEQKTFKAIGCSWTIPSLPDRLNVVLDEIPRSPTRNLLALNGVDHMFPNPKMPQTLEKIRELHPEVEVVQSTFDNYIADVRRELSAEPDHISGEQRDGRENLILPASQSMRMDVKCYNGRMEDRMIRVLEPQMALCSVCGMDNLPYSEADYAWELMLQNHAHDSLCCANSEPSYREILTRYDKISDVSREIINENSQRFNRLIKDMPEEGIVISNPSAFERDGIVELEIIASADNRSYPEPELWADGKKLDMYITGLRTDTLLRFVPSTGFIGQLQCAIFTVTADVGKLPPLGWKTVEIKGGFIADRPVSGLAVDSNTLENKYIKAKVEADGTVTVTDKVSGNVFDGLNRIIDDGENGNGFQHVAPYHDETFVSSGEKLSIAVKENNPLRGVLTVRQYVTVPKTLSADRFGRSSELVSIAVSTDIILTADAKQVEFVTTVDNTALNHRLRVAFPTDADTYTAYAGQPYDIIRRPVQPENPNHTVPGEYEPFVGYHPMHDLCGITDGKRGAMLCGDGILEYEVLPARRTVCLTLIRATDRLLVGVLETGSKFRLPAAQLQGEHTFRYVFIPHTGEPEDVMSEADIARHPLNYAQRDYLEAEFAQDYTPPTPYLPLSSGFISLDGRCVMNALKEAEDRNGIIIRMYNPTEKTVIQAVNVDKNFKLNGASKAELDESTVNTLEINGNGIRAEIKPKEIATFRLNISFAG